MNAKQLFFACWDGFKGNAAHNNFELLIVVNIQVILSRTCSTKDKQFDKQRLISKQFGDTCLRGINANARQKLPAY